MRDDSRKITLVAAAAVGSACAFVAAILMVLVWVATGPAFHFS
ncbi:MAG: low affinity iron permease family protein [Acidobacteriota bacterium]